MSKISEFKYIQIITNDQCSYRAVNFVIGREIVNVIRKSKRGYIASSCCQN